MSILLLLQGLLVLVIKCIFSVCVFIDRKYVSREPVQPFCAKVLLSVYFVNWSIMYYIETNSYNGYLMYLHTARRIFYIFYPFTWFSSLLFFFSTNN